MGMRRRHNNRLHNSLCRLVLFSLRLFRRRMWEVETHRRHNNHNPSIQLLRLLLKRFRLRPRLKTRQVETRRNRSRNRNHHSAFHFSLCQLRLEAHRRPKHNPCKPRMLRVEMHHRHKHNPLGRRLLCRRLLRFSRVAAAST